MFMLQHFFNFFIRVPTEIFKFEVSTEILDRIKIRTGATKVQRWGYKNRKIRFLHRLFEEESIKKMLDSLEFSSAKEKADFEEYLLEINEKGTCRILLPRVVVYKVDAKTKKKMRITHELIPSFLYPFIQYTRKSFAMVFYHDFYGDTDGNLVSDNECSIRELIPCWLGFIEEDYWDDCRGTVVSEANRKKVIYLNCAASHERVEKREKLAKKRNLKVTPDCVRKITPYQIDREKQTELGKQLAAGQIEKDLNQTCTLSVNTTPDRPENKSESKNRSREYPSDMLFTSSRKLNFLAKFVTFIRNSTTFFNPLHYINLLCSRGS